MGVHEWCSGAAEVWEGVRALQVIDLWIAVSANPTDVDTANVDWLILQIVLCWTE